MTLEEKKQFKTRCYKFIYTCKADMDKDRKYWDKEIDELIVNFLSYSVRRLKMQKREKTRYINNAYKRYKEKLTKDDLLVATTNIQEICKFNPPLKLHGDTQFLKNQIYLTASQLYPEDSKLFNDLTNWVLHKLGIVGWVNVVVEKPSLVDSFDLIVASKIEKSNEKGTLMNNYNYPSRNPFIDSYDVLGIIVNQLMYKEKNKLPIKQCYSMKRTYILVEKILKYIQLWCQMQNFDLTHGIKRNNNRGIQAESDIRRIRQQPLEDIERKINAG